MSAPSKHTKSVLTFLVKAALAAAVLGYLVYAIDPDDILAALRNARPLWLALAALLLPLNLLLEGAVWRTVLRSIVPEVSWKKVYGALLSGFAMGIFTPGRVGDFAGRAFYLQHADRWETSATVLAQRLIDMAVSVTIGCVAVGYATVTGELTPSQAWWSVTGIGAVIGVGLLFALLRPGPSARFLQRFIPSEAVTSRLAFLERLRIADMARALLIALLRFGVYVLQFAFLFFAFAPDQIYPLAFLGVLLTFFAKFLAPSLTLMDIGIREGFAVFFFGALGLSDAAAFNAALFIFVLNLALPALAGAPFLFRLRLISVDQDDTPRKQEEVNASRPVDAPEA